VPVATGPELLVITGMSGAGRSTAARVLEDLGWYVVDNLPPQMIATLADLTAGASPGVPRIAVVVDVRGGSFFAELQHALAAAQGRGMPTRMLFLDATDDALVRRYESVRRPHPLQGAGTILEGIARERGMVIDLRDQADTVLDTSVRNIHELARAIVDAFGDSSTAALRVSVMSFGFKYGLPLDADNVADVRFLPNPFWVPELRPQSGRDAAVRDYVLAREGAQEFLQRYAAALQPVLGGYVRENKRYATVALGCTGGRHRSVAMAEALAVRIADGAQAVNVAVSTVHRDLGRE
jgi:UPF0042 nucleotide-binding protein